MVLLLGGQGVLRFLTICIVSSLPASPGFPSRKTSTPRSRPERKDFPTWDERASQRPFSFLTLEVCLPVCCSLVCGVQGSDLCLDFPLGSAPPHGPEDPLQLAYMVDCWSFRLLPAPACPAAAYDPTERPAGSWAGVQYLHPLSITLCF